MTPPAEPAAAGPLRAVLAELRSGTRTLDEVSRRTGLPRDVVGAAVEQLVRLGRVTSSTLGSGCPEDGCGTCSSGTSCAVRSSRAPSGRRPVLVALSVRRPAR
ncbi:MAG TPA: FeoC-like transcriptional regulator [Kineosporiaceae bacterium]